MTTVTYSVPAIHCAHCVHTIQAELMEIAGVRKVVASLEPKQVTVEFEPPATESQIEAMLADIHYPVAR